MDTNHRKEIFFKDKLAPFLLSEFLEPFLMKHTVLVCIGTDKCIGDSLGPLVGTLLSKNSFPFPVYGTLSTPVHAVNLKEKLNYINNKHPFSFTIAIDACLSDEGRVGNIEVRKGPIYPGKGIGKKLPSVGDLSVVGIVDSIRNDNNISLHNIRLSFVMDMAETIVEAFSLAVKKYGK